jgi:2Fe-2S ferredoxin
MGDVLAILIQPDGHHVQISDARAGETLMEAARRAGVAGIVAECGGACSCATCHVYLDAGWFAKVGAPDQVEEEMLDMVDHIRRPTSRLSCQIRLHEGLSGIVAEVAPEL